jgi:hypothetical protein
MARVSIGFMTRHRWIIRFAENQMGEIKMNHESFDAFKIHRVPSMKFFFRGHEQAICLPNGNLRFFETEREARSFLTDCDRAEIDKIAAQGSRAEM